MLLGAHESIAKGFGNAIAKGSEDGCECVQVFTKSASQWSGRALTADDRESLDAARKETGISRMASHDSYLINLASPNPEAWKKSRGAFLEEVRRAEYLGIQALIFHPGSHAESGEAKGIQRIGEALGDVLEQTKAAKVNLLLETTAGQGSYIGHRFEHMAEIIDLAGGNQRMGLCFDTCHAFSAGYEIRTAKGWDDTLDDFHSTVGLDRLRAFHLNDTMNDFGSRKDRHEQIGNGKIGIECFRYIVNDRRFEDVPGYLETPPLPTGEDSFAKNLRVLKSLRAEA
ncbi:MAG: deoxyribonuclease IV [Methanobacteriota archaeon]